MKKIKDFFKDYVDFDLFLSIVFWGIVIYCIVFIGHANNTKSSDIPLNTTSYSLEKKKKIVKIDNSTNTSSSNATTKNEVDRTELNYDNNFECDYILNKNTKKFHYTWCSSVKNMKTSNTKEFAGTRDEVINMGYSPCKRCNP